MKEKKENPQLIFSQNELVDLITERLREFAVRSSKGVYNHADPTQFERFTSKIGMYPGFSMDEESNFPLSENIEVRVNDVTWGIEFEIDTSTGRHSGYWSRELGNSGGEWCRCSPEFLNVLKAVFLYAREPDFWEHEDMGDDGIMTSPEACR